MAHSLVSLVLVASRSSKSPAKSRAPSAATSVTASMTSLATSATGETSGDESNEVAKSVRSANSARAKQMSSLDRLTSILKNPSKQIVAEAEIERKKLNKAQEAEERRVNNNHI
eukprot:53678-Prorocentrum_minimum.AAC.6